MSMPAPSGGKPAMERRRRARINESLSQLKLLIMDDLVDQVLISLRHIINSINGHPFSIKCGIQYDRLRFL